MTRNLSKSLSQPLSQPLSLFSSFSLGVLLALLFLLPGCEGESSQGPLETPPESSQEGAALAEVVRAEHPVQIICGADQTLHGMDVSHWQGEIDWDAVAAGGDIDFAYIRIGDGLGTDSEFVRNWAEARRVGIPRGAYQYFRPNRDAHDQVVHFMEMVDSAGGYSVDDLPPLIDVETMGNQSVSTVRSSVHAWVDEMESIIGKRAILYTGPYFWDDNGLGSEFSDLHLWTAHYTSASCPLIPNAWDAWTIWQYTSSGSVTGIDGNVDLNRFSGTLQDLAAWPTCSQFNPLSDCGVPDWWCDAIGTLNGLGVMEESCQDFDNGATFSRERWAQLIGRALKLESAEAFGLCRLPFSDVDAASASAPYIASLAALDYGDDVTVFSTENPTFNPSATATRCDAVKMVAEAWNLPPAPEVALLFTDIDQIDGWCFPYLRSAALAQVINNAEITFRAKDAATVGETAAMIAGVIGTQGRRQPSTGDFNDLSCQPICQDQCAPDAKECTGRDILQCGEGANGCMAWEQPTSCPPKEGCSEGGLCVTICEDTCTLEDRICDGEGVQTCILGVEGCLVWSEADACRNDESCDAGACISDCAATCEKDTRRCWKGGVQKCASAADGCTYWVGLATCPEESPCADGACSCAPDDADCGEAVVDPETRSPGGINGDGDDSCSVRSIAASNGAPNSSTWLLGLLFGFAFALRRRQREGSDEP